MPRGKLVELGFDGARRLEIAAGGTVRSFEVGRRDDQLFALRDAGGRVYSPLGSELRSLEADAAELASYQLHRFAMSEADAIVLEADGRVDRFRQSQPAHAELAALYSAGAREVADQRATRWHRRVWDLPVSRVLAIGEEPDIPPRAAARVDYLAGDRRVGWLELARIPRLATDADDLTVVSDEWWAKSEATAGWVRVAMPEDLWDETLALLPGVRATP